MTNSFNVPRAVMTQPTGKITCEGVKFDARVRVIFWRFVKGGNIFREFLNMHTP